MKKLFLGILVLGLLWCNVGFSKDINGLFGLKLGQEIDESLIIEPVNEFSKHYQYTDITISENDTYYKVNPPLKNKIFNNYFVGVNPISNKIYVIYAYRKSWDEKYNSKLICPKGEHNIILPSSVEGIKSSSKKEESCRYENPETLIQLDKLNELNFLYFKALEKFFIDKYKIEWKEDKTNYISFNYWYNKKTYISLRLSNPNKTSFLKILQDYDDAYMAVNYPDTNKFKLIPNEVAISIHTNRDKKEYKKLEELKIEKENKKKNKIYEKVLDQTGL